MGTLVCFHAHPDDESVITAGTMAKAVEDGHRVVLITATRGEHGEVADGYLLPGESLGERRVSELADACRILGVSRHEYLGYVDSGMMGTAENLAPGAFWQADVHAAASRLADILASERADALTIYDERGNYGHPDHIQVHRVGVRAAALAGLSRVFEATVNRDHMRELMKLAAEMGVEDLAEASELQEGMETMGSPASAINTVVDVRPWLDVKRQALLAHGSQISETSFFASLPDEAFAAAFGQEWYIRRDPPLGWAATDLFEGRR